MNKKLKVLAMAVITIMLFANLSTICKYVYAETDNLEKQNTLTNDASVNFNSNYKEENETTNIQVTLENDVGANKEVKEGQVINYTATVVNTGNETLNNITLEANIPDGTTYREFVAGGNYSYDEYITDNRKVCTKTIDTLKAGESESLVYQVIVNEKENGIEKISAQATAKIEGYKDIQSKTIENTVIDGMLSIDLITKEHSTEKYITGSKIIYIAYVQNIKSVDATNVKIICKLPEGVSFNDAYFAVKMENDGKEVKYDKKTNTVVWTIDKLEAGSRVEVQLSTIVNNDVTEIKNTFSVECEETASILSNEVIRYVDKADLSISQYSNIQEDTYINVGDVLEYYITVKNNGTRTAENVKIIDTLPDGLENVILKYKNGDEEEQETECLNKEITLSGFEIDAGETLNIIITAKVSELSNDAKGTINYTNKVKVSADDINEITANEITHKLKIENSNIDLKPEENAVFDLNLTKTISKITVNNSNEMKSYEYKNKTLAKIEVASKDINDTTVIIEYTITIKNEGNIAGYAKSIVDYLPNDLKFSSQSNKDWFVGMNGNLYNESLANTIIQPGESKDVKLIVTKTLNENNLGTTKNSAEIAESYNDYGIEDIDSIAGNQLSKEDDYGSADMIISLNTGKIVVYIGLSITVITIIIVGIYLIKKKVLIEV